MTWFFIDDGFYSHPKTISIPRSIRATAIGTWTLAGTWSADKLTDGKVPANMLEELACPPEAVEALIQAKLWKKTRHGIAFVNWSEWQKTRAQVLEKREADRNRKKSERAAAPATARLRPAGQEAASKPPVPSLPIEEDKHLGDRPNSHSGQAQDDQLSTGLSPAVDAVLRGVEKHCGITLHPLAAHMVIEWFDARRGANAPELKVPARYYGSAIAQSSHEVAQFIHQKGIAA